MQPETFPYCFCYLLFYSVSNVNSKRTNVSSIRVNMSLNFSFDSYIDNEMDHSRHRPLSFQWSVISIFYELIEDMKVKGKPGRRLLA